MAVRNILMKLTADPSQAERGLQSFNQKLEKFTATKSERLIDLKTQASETRLTQLQERLDRLSKQEATPAVKLQLGRTAQQIERLQRDLTGVEKKGQGAGLSLRKLAGAAAGLGVGFAAFNQARKAVDTTTELAHSTLLLSHNFGLTVNEASRWAAIAQSRGIQPTALVMGFKALSTQVHNASEAIQAGGGKAVKQAQAFRILGISQEELVKHGGDIQWVLGRVSDGLAKLPAGTERAAVSAKLFGRTWTGVAPLIRNGSKNMEEQLALAEKYGATFHGHTIKSLHEFIQAQREGKIATLGLQVAFGTELAPALTKAIHGVTKFVSGMREGTGAGGRFARGIRPVVNAVKAIVGWFSKHPHAITVALGAWLAYKVGVFKIIGAVRRSLLGEFRGLGPAAARGGAVAGTQFGRTASTNAARGMGRFNWRGLGLGIGSILGVAIAYEIEKHLPKAPTKAQGWADRLFPLQPRPYTPGGGTARSLPELLKLRREHGIVGLFLSPDEQDMLSAYDARRLGGYPDGGAATNRTRTPPRHRRGRRGAPNVTIPAVGGDAHARALRLQLSSDERAYAAAVRKYGPNSAAAIRAADAVQSDHDAITSAAKSASPTRRTRRARGERSIPVTAAERAEQRAADRYRQAVEAHGADSRQAKLAGQRLGISKIGVEIGGDRSKLSEAIRRFGKNSEQAFKAQLALTGALTQLAKANDKLKGSIDKNTKTVGALLPKATDIFDPSSRPHHAAISGGWPGGGPLDHRSKAWGGGDVYVGQLVMPKTAAPSVNERYDATKLHRHLRRLGAALPA